MFPVCRLPSVNIESVVVCVAIMVRPYHLDAWRHGYRRVVAVEERQPNDAPCGCTALPHVFQSMDCFTTTSVVGLVTSLFHLLVIIGVAGSSSFCHI